MSPGADKDMTGSDAVDDAAGLDADGDGIVTDAEAGRGRRARERKVKGTSLWTRLYHGDTTFNIVGRRRLFFVISGVFLLVGLGSLVTRGLNLGIDFEGGDSWEVPSEDISVGQVRDSLDKFGLADAKIQTLEDNEGNQRLQIQSEAMDPADSREVTRELADLAGVKTDDVSVTQVSPSWGSEISEKALRALIVFLILVTIYIALRFELKMAIPTLAALIHDVLLTVGVYALTQFEVTPATVIAILTILGFSIYDGIVVFDKVDENTRLVSSTGGVSYSGMVNLSLNQTLMRSLNTSLTAVLPVASLLIVGSWIMGATTLEDFALALMIGLFSGAYSSIFIASPLLAVLKEREPRYRDIKRRIDARGGDQLPGAAIATGADAGSGKGKAPVGAGSGSGSGSGSGGKAPATVGTQVSSGNGGAAPVRTSTRVIPPRPRKKDKRSR
jgi:preprotein translocase subunit SecF